MTRTKSDNAGTNEGTALPAGARGFPAEQAIIDALKERGIEYAATLPCIKIMNLIRLAGAEFQEIPLTREEDGVGIACGAFLAGKRMALMIQSGGIGNSLNALLSLARFYKIPLPMLISWRGGPEEPIAAQRMMGSALTGLLEAASIPCIDVDGSDSPTSGAAKTRRMLDAAYSGNTPAAALFRPSFWHDGGSSKENGDENGKENAPKYDVHPGDGDETGRCPAPPAVFMGQRNVASPGIPDRISAIKSAAQRIGEDPCSIIVSNIGYPSRELYAVADHPRNFYMLGSLGMASSIGLGLALAIDRNIYVMDGDGSVLMNPNALITAAACEKRGLLRGRLIIICMDNGVHGSTGEQSTYSGRTLELEQLARGAGIRNTVSVADEQQLRRAVGGTGGKKRLVFVHVKVGRGNADVGVIPLGGVEIKQRFMEFIGRPLL